MTLAVKGRLSPGDQAWGQAMRGKTCGSTIWAEKCLSSQPGELLGVEGLQVFGLFAQADEFDGQAQFALDGHRPCRLCWCRRAW
jgi:hypothetical protein